MALAMMRGITAPVLPLFFFLLIAPLLGFLLGLIDSSANLEERTIVKRNDSIRLSVGIVIWGRLFCRSFFYCQGGIQALALTDNCPRNAIAQCDNPAMSGWDLALGAYAYD